MNTTARNTPSLENTPVLERLRNVMKALPHFSPLWSPDAGWYDDLNDHVSINMVIPLDELRQTLEAYVHVFNHIYGPQLEINAPMTYDEVRQQEVDDRIRAATPSRGQLMQASHTIFIHECIAYGHHSPKMGVWTLTLPLEAVNMVFGPELAGRLARDVLRKDYDANALWKQLTPVIELTEDSSPGDYRIHHSTEVAVIAPAQKER